MADPEGGVILHLGDKRERAAASVPGFHNEFLVFQRLRQKESMDLNLKLPGKRIIVSVSFCEEVLTETGDE